jgi:glycosyltransferase involved in cell wall biosynthesis
MISIIIPAYNAGKTIEKCLEHVLRQKYYSYEVVVVNDGSTDDTWVKLQQQVGIFLNQKISFKIINQNNSGANTARNRGAKEARGELIIFLDADIQMEQNMLDAMKMALDMNPAASYAYSSHFFGFKLFKLFPFNEEKLRTMPCIHTSSLIRREHFPGFDESLNRLRFQDWDLWLTMLEAGHTGVFIDKPLFRIATGGTMSSWLPGIAYKIFPFLPAVKKYKNASEIIRKKHNLE